MTFTEFKPTHYFKLININHKHQNRSLVYYYLTEEGLEDPKAVVIPGMLIVTTPGKTEYPYRLFLHLDDKLITTKVVYVSAEGVWEAITIINERN